MGAGFFCFWTRGGGGGGGGGPPPAGGGGAGPPGPPGGGAAGGGRFLAPVITTLDASGFDQGPLSRLSNHSSTSRVTHTSLPEPPRDGFGKSPASLTNRSTISGAGIFRLTQSLRRRTSR